MFYSVLSIMGLLAVIYVLLGVAVIMAFYATNFRGFRHELELFGSAAIVMLAWPMIIYDLIAD